MSKLLHEITRDFDVGIWGDRTTTARIYNDKIIVGTPYIKWVDDSGNLDFKKIAIRNQTAVDLVAAKMASGDEDAAWGDIQYLITYQD